MTLRNRRTTLFAILAFALCVAGQSGCASRTPAEAKAAPSPAEALAEAPRWVVEGCRAYWPDETERREVVCGVGSAAAHRNRVAVRDTAIARARAEISRSLVVTIESLVRLEETERGEAELQTIIHQLSSTSLRGVQLEETWKSMTGEVHALVSLDLARVQESVRSNPALSPATREDLAARAAAAFAAFDERQRSEASR